jgi:hypothetical protein
MMLLHSISCKQITPENLKNMDNIKAILDNEVSKGRTPSVQYLFFNTDTVLYEYANGYSDLKKGTKVDDILHTRVEEEGTIVNSGFIRN